MFLHFIQKKGWLGVKNRWGDGDKKYLINSTKEYRGANYFNDFLEPLFYKALNVSRENDLYLGEKIPFLNGGLFHPIEDYDWENTNFNIPNEYWFNKGETGLLNILSQYNFTVDEADLEEQEVAIDPEMLGKIFESLLDVRDRAKLGAFYTPREIVHFMCEESLAVRISNDLRLDYDSILNFIRYGDALKETEFIEVFAEEVDEYINRLTIVDPSVGSGAYLVGMLNQIVKLRSNLLEISGKKVDKYEIKINAIQNSLYGVDIEFDAVEIAKLRLWLSLIVDQETEGNKPRPLPNLNFHLRVGNSLVDTFDNIKLWNVRWRGTKKEKKVDNQINIFNVDTVAEIMYRLKNAKNEFFNTSNEQRKNELSKQIEREQIELIRAELVSQGKFALFDQIDDMLKRKTKPFFIWELEFEEVFENGGFDIVIGNPPYGLVNKKQNKSDTIVVSEAELSLYKTDDIYKPAKGGVINIYRLFICKSIDLLKDKGCLNLIFPMAFMGDLTASALRKFIFNNMKINYIEAFPERDDINKRVFQSAKMSVCILNATKAKLDSKLKMRIQDNRFVNLSYPYVEMDTKDLKVIEPKGYTIPLVNQREYDLLRQLNENTRKLVSYSKCYTGEIYLSLNKKFYGLIKNDTPLLRGAQVQRWHITEKISQGELLYINKPLYLSENSSPKSRHYKNKRIVMQGITGVNEKYRLKMTMIENNEFCANSVNYLVLENDDENQLLYLLGILNSSLINWYFKKFSTNSNVNGYEIDNIPIMEDDNYRNELIDLVRNQLKNSSEERENKINNLVLKIYNIKNFM